MGAVDLREDWEVVAGAPCEGRGEITREPAIEGEVVENEPIDFRRGCSRSCTLLTALRSPPGRLRSWWTGVSPSAAGSSWVELRGVSTTGSGSALACVSSSGSLQTSPAWKEAYFLKVKIDEGSVARECRGLRRGMSGAGTADRLDSQLIVSLGKPKPVGI